MSVAKEVQRQLRDLADSLRDHETTLTTNMVQRRQDFQAQQREDRAALTRVRQTLKALEGPQPIKGGRTPGRPKTSAAKKSISPERRDVLIAFTQAWLEDHEFVTVRDVTTQVPGWSPSAAAIGCAVMVDKRIFRVAGLGPRGAKQYKFTARYLASAQKAQEASQGARLKAVPDVA